MSTSRSAEEALAAGIQLTNAGHGTKAISALSEAIGSCDGNQKILQEAYKWMSIASRLAYLATSSSAGVPIHTAAAEMDKSAMEFFLFEQMEVHAEMLEDSGRVNAFQRAIQRTVKPGQVVFEIGTGTGILTMFAAQQRPELVVSCERVPWVAEAARRVVRANGFTESQVRVVAKSSLEVEVPTDLPRPADVIVAEIIGNQMVDEGVISLMNDARRRLMVQGGAPKAIPARGKVWAVLVEAESLRRPRGMKPEFLGRAYGLDLSEFNSILPEDGIGEEAMSALDDHACHDPEEYFMWTKTELGSDVVDDKLWRHKYLSDPFEVFSFDFMGDDVPTTNEKELEVNVTRSGELNGILSWIELDVDPEGTVRLVTCPKDLLAARGLGKDVLKANHWNVRIQSIVPGPAVKGSTQDSKAKGKKGSSSHGPADKLVIRASYKDTQGTGFQVDWARSTVRDPVAAEKEATAALAELGLTEKK